MAKRIRTMYCSHEGCGEVTRYEFNNREEIGRHIERVTDWKCLRHRSPNEVLSLHNTEVGEILTCKAKYTDDGSLLGHFWQKDSDKGTDRVSSGFQYGNGYKAFAKDFPEGTVLIVNAEVIIPNK